MELPKGPGGIIMGQLGGKMNAYPAAGACSPRADHVVPMWERNDTICHDYGGSCVEGRSVCKCPRYYAPLNNCTTTVYGAVNELSVFYVTYGFAWCFVFISLIALEIGNDYATHRIVKRNKVLYAKAALLLATLIKLSGLSLLVWGVAHDSVVNASHEAAMNMTALALFQASFMLSAIYWFELIENAKHIWTDVPPGVVVCKRIVLAMVLTIALLIVYHLLGLYGVVPEDAALAGTVILFIIIVTTFIINLIFLVRARRWFNDFDSASKEDETVGRRAKGNARKYDILKRKTRLLLITTLWFICSATGGLSTYLLPTDIAVNLVMTKILILAHESTNGVLLYLFLENGLRKRYSALRAVLAPHLFDSMARAGDSSGIASSSTLETSRRRKSKKSQDATLTTPSGTQTQGGQSTSSTVIQFSTYSQSQSASYSCDDTPSTS